MTDLMKKVSAFGFTLLVSLFSFAQHAQEEVDTESAEPLNNISDDTKWVMVVIWTIIIIILVLRTFRNKPTV